MSLPPGFLDELRTRTTLSSIVGRKVTWDARKSNMAKGDWWAPCPFHQEKSASFHVDDRKGFYYCFGCHAKGDALTFLRESENLPFMEAVEVLARDAGMVVPARDPKAAEVSDRRSQLIVVLEEASKFYRLQLKASAGAAARRYLAEKRGLTDAACEKWMIGWSPENAQAIVDLLASKGVSPELMVASGVVAKSDSGRLYDRFHARVIFPIKDPRGRVISFGGRSLDPNARAKYLNGPETDVFDKGRSLFNLAQAREAAGKGAPLIVAEGYMDVIALSEAGFHGSVAPLGTAVTEDQLRLMWRVQHEPIIALDGDKAGIRAALRVIDLALPHLEAGKGLRFAVLPDGQDPDDLIKKRGAAAMQTVIDTAQPMVRLIWDREIDGQVFDSPERRATLDKSLRELLKRINDPSIRAHYTDELKRLRWGLFGEGPRGGASAPKRWQGNPRFQPKGAPQPPLPGTRASSLGSAAGSDETLREAVILAILIVHPTLVASFESSIDRLDFNGPGHRDLRDAILRLMFQGGGVDLMAELRKTQAAMLDALFDHPHVKIAPPVRNKSDEDLARLCLAEELSKLSSRRAIIDEVEEAAMSIAGLADEGLTWRLSEAVRVRDEAGRSRLSDQTDLGEDRSSLLRQLHDLSDQIGPKKIR